MQKALLIAEKPSLRRKIEDVYNKHKSEIPYNITFTEQRGHLLTLKMPNELDEDLKKWEWDTLPIQPEDYGGWKYKVINEKKVGSYLTAKERFHNIKDEYNSGKYDLIIHAGDPDQEGELLVRIVLLAIKNKLPVKRFWSNDITDAKILDALKNLKDDDKDPMLVNLFAASIARQHSDWRVGINVSRAATLKLNLRVACGRVKTPIMSIVCEREKEIQAFIPKTVYGIKADYDTGFSGQMFDPGIVSGEEEERKDESEKGLVWFDAKKEAKDLISTLSYPATVKSYKSEKTTTFAPKLFKLATAQIAAGKRGYSASQTLDIIQGLYEKGYLSYPRTDCEYISSGENLNAMLKSADSVPTLKPFITLIDPSAIGKVKATKKWVNDAKLKESGHSALVPTTSAPDFSKLTSDEQFIYELICRQFVAIFLPPLIQNKTELITDISGHLFKSSGKTLVDEGYAKIFGTKFTDVEIPEYKKGDLIEDGDFSIAEKTSTCPKRFTDATLVQMCENPAKFLDDKSLKSLGKNLQIGTPATRASIIEELITKDKYLKRKKEGKTQNIVPTDTGMTIYDALKGREITKVDMTGKWELLLEDIRTGKMTLKDFEEEMQHDVRAMVEDIKDSDIKATSAGHTVIGTCPECGSDLIEGPKSFYCSGYKEKDCHIGAFKKICDSPLKTEEFLSLISGETIEKEIKKGEKSWKQKIIYDFDEHKIQFVKASTAEIKETDYECPGCGANMNDKGKLLECPDCGFTFWKSSCGVELAEEQIDDFFHSGHTGLVKGLKSKKGNKFNADIVYDANINRTTFKFEDKK